MWNFLLQAGNPEIGVGLGTGGLGLAGVIFYFYRQDRAETAKRYEELAGNFRKIVEDNTAAVTSLRDALALRAA